MKVSCESYSSPGSSRRRLKVGLRSEVGEGFGVGLWLLPRLAALGSRTRTSSLFRADLASKFRFLGQYLFTELDEESTDEEDKDKVKKCFFGLFCSSAVPVQDGSE